MTAAAETAPQQSLASRDFIVSYPGALSAEVCRTIIEEFEADRRKRASKTASGTSGGGRTGAQLDMAGHPEWAELKKIVTDKTVECMHDYAKRFSSLEFILRSEEVTLSPPVIERVEVGQGFDWHIDSGPLGTARRFLSALTYLNDVDDGGKTEFPLQGAALRPERGTIVMFPPYWLYPHRGAPPAAAAKYKMTAYFMVPEKAQHHL